MAESERDWVEQRLARWRESHDREALGELLKWQRDRAYAIGLRIAGGADAEDAVQQAFVKLLSRTHGFEDANQFRVAIYRAVVQSALDMARTRRVQNKLEKVMRQPQSPSAASPLAAAEQAEALRLVFEELDRLSEADRAAVVLCCQEGLSVYDAAEALAVPRETLRYRLSASMAQLRKNLIQRGVPLTLVLLAGLLQSGSATAAPLSLCAALDQTLPGGPCAAVRAAGALKAAPEALAALLQPTALSVWARFALATSAVVLLSVGGAAVWSATRTHSVEQAPVATPAVTGTAWPEKATAGAPDSQRVPSAPEAKAAGPAVALQPGKLALDALPIQIRTAASRAIAGIALSRAELERENGQLVYALVGRANGVDYEVKVSLDAKVLEVDKADDEEDGARAPAPPPAAPKGDF